MAILNGWKEIAKYMGRSPRTLQRWELLGFPIRRPVAQRRSAVIAVTDELEQWSKSRPVRDRTDDAAEITALRNRVAELEMQIAALRLRPASKPVQHIEIDTPPLPPAVLRSAR